MKVLIIAKTRQHPGACVGGITTEGRSVRLISPDPEDPHPNVDYEVGEVWEVEIEEPASLLRPHVENVVVVARRRLGTTPRPATHIERHMPPLAGGPECLYEGLCRTSPSGKLYIGPGGIPSRSTQFWRPDRALYRTESGTKRIRYRYGDPEGGPSLVFVGFQEPPELLPAGSLVRVSLAHWWRPDDEPEAEERCWVQLSGWFLGAAPPEDEAPPLPEPEPEVEPDETRHAAVSRLAGVAAAGPTPPLRRPDFAEAGPVLREVFGFREFRALQETAIRRVLAGEDTLAVMPTGGGKSLLYQLPALLFEGLTVVVSPLISLMRDQVEQLRALGIAATFLNSSLTHAEYVREARQVTEGGVRLLYLAPETLVRPETLVMLDRARVQCFAIDEAHCISQWGHDFREVYRRLLPVRDRFRQAVCIALTATASPRVRQDIQRTLGIPDEGVLVANFDRPNLHLACARRTGVEQLIELLAAHPEESGIIYCATQKATEALAADLTARGYRAQPYHAGLDTATRTRHQRDFNRDEVRIIVATVAFGMGINKSNIRFVAHYSLPESLENYYQEVGRAGRDGLRADCLLLHGEADTVLHRRFIEQAAPAERAGRQARLGAMRQFALTTHCRRTALLPYFGDRDVPDHCGMCDNCTCGEAPAGEATDLTHAARLFLQAVLETGQTFGIQHVIDVLRGSQNRRLLDRGHHRLPAYASGTAHSGAQWRRWADAFLDEGVIEQDLEYGSVKITPAGNALVRGERSLLARVEPVAARAAAATDADYDRALFEALRTRRKELADAQGVPPFVIFSDRTLVEMAQFFPQSEAALLGIHGVGRQKLESYGAAFLEVLRDYCSRHDRKETAPTSSPPPAPKADAGPRAREVGRLFAEGRSLEEIGTRFGVRRRTVLQNLVEFHQHGGAPDGERVLAQSELSLEQRQAVLAAFARHGLDRLRPVFEELGEQVSYEELHLLRLFMRISQAGP